jgi:Na+-translocating ferredoxin:NAD+ oxidoreductase RNF subunit RnfB
MGHTTGSDIYRKLGRKVDNLPIRAPWNRALHDILKSLYSQEEADVVVKMPYGASTLENVAKVTKYESTKLKAILDRLCAKGLVMDLFINNDYHYMPSPMVIGIFEFTMMRTGDNLDSKGWSKLFNRYLPGALYAGNFSQGETTSVMRTVPHDEVIRQSPHVEVLDYEKATSIIESHNKFSIGLCSCRHEKHHLNEKRCDVPLETCSSFGYAADYMIRNDLAKEVSKSEMLDQLARSKEMGLVLNADNVQKNVTYICHCCGCCCNVLLGISKYGYDNVVVTSNYIAQPDEQACIGCGKCAEACPINAIEMVPLASYEKKKKIAVVDSSICIGCGVCGLKCKNESMSLVARKQRVLHPETTFQRVILQCLDRGTLQNQIFDNPGSITQAAMRGIVGAFLMLTPVKKALMSDMLRSSFLKAMETGVKLQGKGWQTSM